MAQAKISTKYQVVIPKEVREQLPVRVGQVVQVVAKRGVITLVPDESPSALHGFLRGMSTEGVREKEDRP